MMTIQKNNKQISVYHFIGMLLMTTAFASCRHEFNEHERQVQTLIARHIRMRGHLQVDDVYKLLMQWRLGIGHMIADSAKAKAFLLDEMYRIDENDGMISDSLLESVSPDSVMLRVNLRPFKKNGYPAELLFQAMLGTTYGHMPEKDKLISDWNVFIQLNRNGHFCFPADELDAFHRKIIENNYPIIHHSKEYSSQYKPAYRVILRSEWEKYFSELIQR